MDSGIYCYHCLANGKKYIGMSKNLIHRHRAHLHNIRNNKYTWLPFYSAVQHHGIEQFVYGIVEYCDVQLLVEREEHYITLYDTLTNGYNVKCAGGGYNPTGNYHQSPKRMPRVLTQTHKNRLSEAATGRVISDAHRQQISNTLSNGAHHNITQWELLHISGVMFTVTNLKQWCRVNGYNQPSLWRVATGKAKRHKDIIQVRRRLKTPKR